MTWTRKNSRGLKRSEPISDIYPMQIFRARPGRGSWRENLVETREIVFAQPDTRRPDIFLQMTARLVARNWNDVVALRHEPGRRSARQPLLSAERWFRKNAFAGLCCRVMAQRFKSPDCVSTIAERSGDTLLSFLSIDPPSWRPLGQTYRRLAPRPRWADKCPGG